MLIVVLVLVVAIARVGAGRNDDGGDDLPDPGDEMRVQPVEIESIDVLLAESFPVQVFVEVTGYLPDPCWEPQEPVVREQGPRFEVEIVAERDAGEMCAQAIEPYQHNIALGTMDPGTYVVSVNGTEQEFEVH